MAANKDPPEKAMVAAGAAAPLLVELEAAPAEVGLEPLVLVAAADRKLDGTVIAPVGRMVELPELVYEAKVAVTVAVEDIFVVVMVPLPPPEDLIGLELSTLKGVEYW